MDEWINGFLIDPERNSRHPATAYKMFITSIVTNTKIKLSLSYLSSLDTVAFDFYVVKKQKKRDGFRGGVG